MTSIPVPPDEQARLAALRELELFDLREEERFARVTRLAARLLDAPIACVSLIESDREWFIACHGAEMSGGSRDNSFCAHTILADETLVIANALDDSRFVDNPQVTGELGIRFYAGHPICAPDGSRIGAISVRDSKPRELGVEEHMLLEDVAHMVEDEIRISRVARLESEILERSVAQKRAEKEHQKFFDLSIDLLCIADFNGYYQSLSPSWEKVTGYTIEELKKAPFVEFVHPGDREATNREAARLAEGAQTLYFENRYMCKDGSIRWLFWTAAPDFEEELIYAVARDMTQRKEWEDAISRAKEEAELASHAKSDFLASMSHELRTPLNSVIGFAKVLAGDKNARLTERQTSYLERISSNGEHLLELINEVLDLAKIEAGRVIINYEAADVGGIIKDVIAQFEPQVSGTPTTLTVEVPEEAKTLTADVRLLRQILFNLIGNAVKFTPEGSVVVRLRVSGGGQPRTIEVADTGIGIPRDKLEAVFESFEQIDSSTTRSFEGTGLGLAICRSLCSALNYRLSVESETGEGSTFRVELTEPQLDGVVESSQKDSQTIPMAMVREIEAAERHGVSFQDKLVLVIDDDPDSRLILSQCLHELGCQVLTATSAAQGVRLARERTPDLVTLDLLMPEMTGWQILGRFTEDPVLRDIPVIVVTAVARESSRAVVGATEIVEKPVDPKRLQRSLERNLLLDAGSVLVVDDNPDDRELISTYFARGGSKVNQAPGGAEALAMLEDLTPDLMIIDLLMPEMDGAELIEVIRRQSRFQDLPILIVTAKDLEPEELERLSRASAAIVTKSPQLRGDLNELCWKLWRLRDSAGQN
jgi:PAS domain S-box-containing protein